MAIHPMAVVSPKAQIDADVEIGPYSVIGPKVRIGRGTTISSHVHVEGDTQIGSRCQVYPGVILGTAGQTKNRELVNSRLVIGNENIIREYVTIHASIKDGATTAIGDRNLFMANSHIAHDCQIGNDVTMANLATLGGHVVVEDQVVIGGLTGVHQFVRIGRLAMVGGMSKLVMDIPPFAMVDGRPAEFCGINAVGLRRAGVDSQARLAIKKALVELFGEKKNLTQVAERVKKLFPTDRYVNEIISFIQKSKRGILRAQRVGGGDEE